MIHGWGGCFLIITTDRPGGSLGWLSFWCHPLIYMGTNKGQGVQPGNYYSAKASQAGDHHG